MLLPSYRIGCGANDRLLQQTVGQIVDISANTTWQYLEMELKTESPIKQSPS